MHASKIKVSSTDRTGGPFRASFDQIEPASCNRWQTHAVTIASVTIGDGFRLPDELGPIAVRALKVLRSRSADPTHTVNQGESRNGYDQDFGRDQPASPLLPRGRRDGRRRHSAWHYRYCGSTTGRDKTARHQARNKYVLRIAEADRCRRLECWICRSWPQRRSCGRSSAWLA